MKDCYYRYGPYTGHVYKHFTKYDSEDISCKMIHSWLGDVSLKLGVL